MRQKITLFEIEAHHMFGPSNSVDDPGISTQS